jgi:hypothetical protein
MCSHVRFVIALAVVCAACGGSGSKDAPGSRADPAAPPNAVGVTYGSGSASSVSHSIAGGTVTTGGGAAASAEHRVDHATVTQ